MKENGSEPHAADPIRILIADDHALVRRGLSMPPPDGIALARELRTVLPETKTVVVSMHEDPITPKAAFAAGASGYVIKRATESQLVEAIHAAVAGRRYIDPFLAHML